MSEKKLLWVQIEDAQHGEVSDVAETLEDAFEEQYNVIVSEDGIDLMSENDIYELLLMIQSSLEDDD